MNELKRRLYKRKNSYEITIPKPILFSLDLSKKHYIIFKHRKGKWIVSFKERTIKINRKTKL